MAFCREWQRLVLKLSQDKHAEIRRSALEVLDIMHGTRDSAGPSLASSTCSSPDRHESGAGQQMLPMPEATVLRDCRKYISSNMHSDETKRQRRCSADSLLNILKAFRTLMKMGRGA